MRPNTKDYADGLRAMLPLLPGVIPFGLIAGVIAAEANFTAAAGIGQSAIIFGGSAQLAATQLMAENAPPLIAILTGLVINLRFAMYSAWLAPHFTGLTTMQRLFAGYFVGDQSYALCATRFLSGEMTRNAKLRFYISGAIALWTVWMVATTAGFFLGNSVPPNWSLDFFVPLGFIALVIPALRDRSTIIAATTGATTVVLAYGLPFNLGLFLAALCGIAAGYLYETRIAARGEPKPTQDTSSGEI